MVKNIKYEFDKVLKKLPTFTIVQFRHTEIRSVYKKILNYVREHPASIAASLKQHESTSPVRCISEFKRIAKSNRTTRFNASLHIMRKAELRPSPEDRALR
jgi:hypothetical protein